MSRRFKLLKWYPSLPESWKQYRDIIVEQVPSSSYKFKELYTPMSEVENNPEFWQEVKEKEYEILQISSPDNSRIDELQSNGEYHVIIDNNIKYDGQFSYPLKSYAIDKQSYWRIYKVKRVLDSTEFKIGDKVYNPKHITPQPFIIDKFYFDCNNEHLLCNGVHTGAGHINITKIEHYKEPLFITEDGFEIEDEKELLWDTSDKNWDFLDQTDAGWFFKYGRRTCPDRKMWKLKENAQKYIEENKPQYSKKQVINILKGFDKEVNEYESTDISYKSYISKYK